jgi:hypothetical protein
VNRDGFLSYPKMISVGSGEADPFEGIVGKV